MQLSLDRMDDPTNWVSANADGMLGSTELSMSTDTAVYRFGDDQTSAMITASSVAFNHTITRTFTPVFDLTDFEEIRFQVRGHRPTQPGSFYLEVRLGSTVLPIDDLANEWHRFVPITQPNKWELVRLHLFDLDPDIISGLRQFQFRCIDAAPPFSLHVDDLIAVRELIVRDVDVALLDRLHERLSIGGSPIPAHIAPDTPANPNASYIKITHNAVQMNPQRRRNANERSNFVTNGYSLLPEAQGYDLTYTLEAEANNRSDIVEMLEFMLVAMQDNLVSNGMELALDPIASAEKDERNGVRLRYVVHTRRESGLPIPAVTPYNEINIGVNATR
jgi:hypothetical protein